MSNSSCDPKAIQDQLNRTEGQILGLNKMFTSSRSCPELLQQIVAARASLSKLGTMILEAEAQGCLTGNESPKVRDLEKVVSNLFKIT